MNQSAQENTKLAKTQEQLFSDLIQYFRHETKTPLTSILLKVQVLERNLKRSPEVKVTNEQILEHLQFIQEQLRKLDAVVNKASSFDDTNGE